jgi:hypothetical protein
VEDDVERRVAGGLGERDRGLGERLASRTGDARLDGVVRRSGAENEIPAWQRRATTRRAAEWSREVGKSRSLWGEDGFNRAARRVWKPLARPGARA